MCAKDQLDCNLCEKSKCSDISTIENIIINEPRVDKSIVFEEKTNKEILDSDLNPEHLMSEEFLEDENISDEEKKILENLLRHNKEKSISDEGNDEVHAFFAI